MLITKIGALCSTLVTYTPYDRSLHASIIQGLDHLLVNDYAFCEAITHDKGIIAKFELDRLIAGRSGSKARVGVEFGSLLMFKVPGLDLADFVKDEFSMAKISQSLLREVVKVQRKVHAIEYGMFYKVDRRIGDLEEDHKGTTS